MKKINTLLKVFTLILFGIGLSVSIFAQVWNGSVMDNNWATPANWDGNMVPDGTIDVEIPMGSTVIILTGTNALTRKVTITGSSLSIQAGASLTINGPSTDNAFDITESTISNDGTIMISNSNSRGIILRSTSMFTNSGTLDVNNSSSDGLHLANSNPGSSFVNNGTLNFNNNGGEAIELRNNAFFRNTADAMINITLVAEEEAIQLSFEGAGFINEGDLYIHSAGRTGIDMEAGTAFTNEATGYLWINDYGSPGRFFTHAIDNEGGVFTNNGNIEIIGGQYSNFGIELDFLGVDPVFPGIFINNGYLSIENIRGEGIIVQRNSTFTNNLLTNIGLRSTSSGFAVLRIRNGGNLTNNTCGIINMTSEDSISVEMGGAITNTGIMTTIYTGLHSNQGDFINNGEIATPDGNFNLSMGSNELEGSTSITTGAIPRQPSLACLGIPIPAMSTWALGILALLFLIVGRLIMKRHQSVYPS